LGRNGKSRNRAVIQGRRFRGRYEVELEDDEYFLYNEELFSAMQFPVASVVDLDSTVIPPLKAFRKEKGDKKRQHRKKEAPKSYAAYLVNNSEECADVQKALG